MDQPNAARARQSSVIGTLPAVPWWYLPLVLGGLSVAIWVPAMLLISKWVLMEASHVAHYISGFAAVCLAFATGLHIITARRHAGQSGNLEHNSQSRGTWRVARRWLGVAGVAGVSIGAESAVHWAASDIHHHIRQRFPNAAGLYANHDVARLVGQTIRVIVLKSREGVSDAQQRLGIERVAEVIPNEWMRLVEARDSRITPLTEEGLWRFVARPDARALDATQWESLLNEWGNAASVFGLTTVTLERLGQDIVATFAFAWREAMKHDFEQGGKAWAALQWDISGELLRRATENVSHPDAAMQAAIVDVASELAILRDKTTELQVMAERQDVHAKGVMQNLRSLSDALAVLAATTDFISQDMQAVRAGIDNLPVVVRQAILDVTSAHPHAALVSKRDLEEQVIANAEILARLERPVADIRLDSIPLEQVFAYISSVSGISIQPNWNRLQECGIDPDDIVTLYLYHEPRGMQHTPSLEEILNGVLGAISDEPERGETLWGVRAGAVIVDCEPPPASNVRVLREFVIETDPQRGADQLARLMTRAAIGKRSEELAALAKRARRLFNSNSSFASCSLADELVSSAVDSLEQDRWAAAEPILVDAVRMQLRCGSDIVDLATTYSLLSAARHKQGKSADDEWWSELFARINRFAALDSDEAAQALTSVGTARFQVGRADEGAQLLRQAIAMRDRLGDPVDAAGCRYTLGFALRSTRDPSGAETALREAIDGYQALKVKESSAERANGYGRVIATAKCELALCLKDLGRGEEAKLLMSEAIAAITQYAEIEHPARQHILDLSKYVLVD